MDANTSMYNVAVTVAPEIRMAPPVAPPAQRMWESTPSCSTIDTLQECQDKNGERKGNTSATPVGVHVPVEKRRRRTVDQLIQTLHDTIASDTHTVVDQETRRCIELGIASAIAITNEDIDTSTVIDTMSLDATRVIQTVISVVSPQIQDNAVIVGAVIESYKKLGYFDASDVIQATLLSPS